MLTYTLTESWDKSQAQGGVKTWSATATRSGDGTMTVCCGPVKPPAAKVLQLQEPLQPSIAHHLVHWYQDMCKDQAPGTSNACLQPAMTFTGQQPSNPLHTYLDILW